MDLSIHKKKNFDTTEKENDDNLHNIYDKLDEKFEHMRQTEQPATTDTDDKVNQIDHFLFKDEKPRYEQKQNEPENTFSNDSDTTTQDEYTELPENETNEPSPAYHDDHDMLFDAFNQHGKQGNETQQTQKKGFPLPKIKIKVNKKPVQTKQRSEQKTNEPKKSFSQLFKKQKETQTEQIATYTDPSKLLNQEEIPTEQDMQMKQKEKKNWFKRNKETAAPNQGQMVIPEPVEQTPQIEPNENKDHTSSYTSDALKKPDNNKPSGDGPLIDENSRPLLDDDVRKLLAITDELLGKLPEHVIEEFASSDDFALYEKIMSKYHIK
jgi:hypothetical protein